MLHRSQPLDFKDDTELNRSSRVIYNSYSTRCHNTYCYDSIIAGIATYCARELSELSEMTTSGLNNAYHNSFYFNVNTNALLAHMPHFLSTRDLVPDVPHAAVGSAFTSS
jgi:hypothetical protein